MFLLLAFGAAAGTITSLDPASIPHRGGEFFLTVYGSGLGDKITFDGAPGRFDLEISASDTGYVIVWIPQEIVNDAGTYNVTAGDSNKATLTVTKPGSPKLSLHLPELLNALAKSRLGTKIEYEFNTTGGEGTINVECDPKSGSTFPYGKSSIRCVASDQAGNRADGVIDVNVWDGTAPVLEYPKSFEVQAENDEGAVVQYTTRAVDDVDGELRVVCSKESGKVFPPGRTTVNCEAVDEALNPAFGSFDVFVHPRDIGRLELKVPDKVVEVAQSEAGAEVFFEVLAYGSADPDPVVTCKPPSGWFFPMKKTRVYCSAEDDFGQRAEGAFDVEVIDRLGLRMPDVTAEATSSNGTEVSWEPVAEDWSNAITCSPSSGSLFDLGATSVDCESTDAKGRRAGGKFTVNVVDTIAPHIGRVRANAGAVDAQRNVVPVEVAVDAIDVADAMPRCSIATLIADGAAFDWRVKSELEVEVGADTSRPFRIQVSCVDASGNRSTDSVAVSLQGTGRRRATR
ncbi:MAG TPA: HYR domain-containing protein [Thermoanaerobaculia bacterium]|nr:HYR domain-containing protein [Thermoanaerobaculia bacterium]